MKKIDTLSYVESLNIPEGYVVERIIATTYSLQPGFIYLLMTLTEPVEEGVFWDALAMRKCINDPQRLKIFYQENKFMCKGSKVTEDFLQIIENCCVPVSAGKFAFHPKIILVEYKKTDGTELKQRLIVSSRNLTISDMVECAVVLEGDAAESIENINDISGLISYVNENDWYLEKKKVSVCFQGNGNKSIGSTMPLYGNKCKKMIVSPFYSHNNFCNKIENAEFYKCSEIHAKIYFFEGEKKNWLWVGSANCTVNGLNHNYECQVGFETELTTAEFRDWIREKNGQEFLPEETVEDDSSSQKTEMDSFLDTYRLKLNIKKKDRTKTLYVCNVEIVPKASENTMNWEFINQFDIRMLGGGKCSRWNDGTMEWEGVAKDISSFAVIRLLNDQRVIKMSMDEETEEIMKELLKERSKKLVADSMNMILPTFKSNNETNDRNDEDDEDDSVERKYACGITLNDGVYETLVKLYAANEKRLLQIIRNQICNNADLYDDNVVHLIKMTEWMDSENERQ